jgi:CelD/BcsL family acetyltransferase involved in cellulose biosynthesis
VLLPLIRRRQNNIVIVEFADLDLTDYNAPILGSAAPRDARAARALWRSVLSALRRMPPISFVFTREPAASFAIITDASEALRILSATEVQQGTRMQSIGLNYILNDETCAAFYRNLVRDGVGNGYALVSALTVGDEVVATLLGIRTGSRYVMIRISNAGEKWSNCSPGRLIIERTMAALHRDGVRAFDFSVGNYAYKRRFGVTRLPLIDISAALSWRGWPFALRDRAVGTLRNHPQLDARLRRVFGKPLSHEEN